MQKFPMVRSSADDNIIEVDDSTLMKPSFDISRPLYNSPPSGLSGPSLGTDLLINKRKISNDVLSISSSGSRSREGSEVEYSGSDSSSSTDTDTSSDVSSSRGEPMNNQYNEERRQNDTFGNRVSAERSRLEKEMIEKKEILYQMDRLETKGYRLPRKFSMQSDLEEMRIEYHRILREKEVDASIRFQRKMLMAFSTGLEFLNTRFDPFDLKLDGWSEQISEDLTDYDDIFEELHDKYKSSGRKMAPELRLLMSLSGSAFMFHLTSSMFKHQPLPDVQQVINSNPALKKQFQQAAAQQYTGMQMPQAQQQAPQMQQSQNPMGGGLFSMLGGLLGGGGANGMMSAFGGPPPPMSSTLSPNGAPSQNKMRGPSIDDLSNDIQLKPTMMNNRVETLSISDEEITSIIEDAADLGGVSRKSNRGRKPGSVSGKKTLNL
jgi:hypothetical protein